MRLDLTPPVIQAELPPRGWRGRLRRLAAEPLLQFLLIGAVLCGAVYEQRQSRDVRRIVVTPGRTAQIARKYGLQFGAPPDAATLERLVRQDVRDEVLFREGEALGLDRNDEIVRRRVVQKAQFLLQAGSPPPAPTAADLRAYADAHPERYVEPARASFSHVFFAGDGGGGEARARAALAGLPRATARAPQAGDPFPDLYDFSAFDADQTARLFGRTPFTAAVFTAPVGVWTGPFRSAYGWHLLRVSARTAAHRPPFDTLATRVRADLSEDAQAAADEAAYARVARRYVVVRADRGAKP